MTCRSVSPCTYSDGHEQEIAELLEGVDDGDGGVRDRGGRTRLATEAFAQIRLHRDRGGQRLQRHAAAESNILGEIDHAHAAASDLFDDLVRNRRESPPAACRDRRVDLRGLFKKVARRFERVEKRLGLTQEHGVATAFLAQPRATNVAGLVERFLEDDLESRELFGCHGALSSRPGARWFALERSFEPDAGQRPLPLDRCRRDADDLRCFLDRQTAEVPQLHDARERLIQFGEPAQRFVQRQYVDVFVAILARTGRILPESSQAPRARR